ncbi:MAG: C40 family peptidase [Shimia sp.]
MIRDRRLRPATERVALAGHGIPDLPTTEGMPARVVRPVLDLRCDRGAERLDRQLPFGTSVTLVEERGGASFVRSHRDGYCGWVATDGLGPPGPAATHRVIAPATLGFRAPDIKAPGPVRLGLGARLSVPGEAGRAEGTERPVLTTACGLHVPAHHCAPLDHRGQPIAVARGCLGVPYLWGGNGPDGMDCSALVQAALEATGIVCPGDSDQQRALGHPIDAADLRSGDLLFWPGHVALATGTAAIVHANAHHMATAEEPLSAAIARIGPPDALRRPA